MSRFTLTELPNEILHEILSFLRETELCTISCVCKLLHELANDDILWRDCFAAKWPIRYSTIRSFKGHTSQEFSWLRRFRVTAELDKTWLKHTLFPREVVSLNVAIFDSVVAAPGEIVNDAGEVNSHHILFAAGTSMNTVNGNAAIYRVDLQAGVFRRAYVKHTSSICSVAMNTATNTIISGGYDCKLLVWSISGECIKTTLETFHTKVIKAVALRDNLGFSGGADKSIAIWDITRENSLPIGVIDTSGSVATIALSGQQFAAGIEDGGVAVYDQRDITSPAITISKNRFSKNTTNLTTIAFGEPFVFASAYDGVLRKFDLRNPTAAVWNVRRNIIFSMNYSGWWRLLAGTRNRLLEVWDVDKAEVVQRPMQHHKDWVMSVSVLTMQDGSEAVVTTSWDKSIVMWKFASLQDRY